MAENVLQKQGIHRIGRRNGAMETKERFISPLIQQQKQQQHQQQHQQQPASKFILEEPVKKLDDLVLPEETRKQINSLLQKVRQHETLYTTFGLGEVDRSGGRLAINLYGPPGTGKTACAEAIANELGRKMIRVNYAEIESKFVGETPKNIKEVFQYAKEKDAILFFDEADSILGKRLSNVSQSTDHAVNVSRSVMLLELDSFQGVTLFATNFMSNYDSAFVRRILGHIEMPLPATEGREALYHKLIPAKYPVAFTEADYREVAEQSQGLSGAEILNVIIHAATYALDREGVTCRVTLSDFTHAIRAVKKAKIAQK